MSISEIASRAMEYLGRARLRNIADDKGQKWLEIPGHTPKTILSFRPVQRGLEIRLKPRPDNDFYEEATTLLLSHLLSEFNPSTFLDIGAAVGHFSFVAATHPTHPKIHAFDMLPTGIERIKRRAQELSMQDQVKAYLAGLSDTHQGTKTIWYSRTRMFENEPEPSEYREPWYIRLKFALQGGSNKRGLFSHQVLLTSIDAFCAEHGVKPDMMKIDVDGYEGKVLTGAHETLRTAQPIILLELHKDKMQRFGLMRKDVVALLFDAGYEALFITDHQDVSKCRLVHAEPSSTLFARQETDMILFCPPRVLG